MYSYSEHGTGREPDAIYEQTPYRPLAPISLTNSNGAQIYARRLRHSRPIFFARLATDWPGCVVARRREPREGARGTLFT